MAWISDDTKTLNAVFYLDDQGNEVTRDDLLEEMWRGYKVWMIFLGGGYVPLTLAAPGDCEGEAYEAVEEWARRVGRPDEINEDVECDQCNTRSCEDTGGNVALYATWMWWNREEDGVSIWRCPNCGWECEEPDDYGDPEYFIQQVPEEVLETAWVLRRGYKQAWVDIWPATVKDIDREPSAGSVVIQSLGKVLTEAQMKALWDDRGWEVVTGNGKIKELLA